MTTSDTMTLVKCPTCAGPITLTETLPHVYKAAAEHDPDCGFTRIKNTLERHL